MFYKHIVLIFDECHRSQFGEMHQAITKAFKQYHLFGFTGTPIFAVNAGSGGNPLMRTTEQAFGDKLHTYTIVDAINDGNVLPFRIDYCDTVKMSPDVQDKQVRAIDVERAMSAPERLREVVRYTLEHFDQKTKRSSFYSHKGKHIAGFNAIFAVASILMLVAKYYDSNCTDKEILTAINKAVNSSLELRSKKALIEGFIARVNVSADVDEDWQKFVREQKEADLNALIEAEALKPEATQRFMDNALRDGALKTTGTDMDSLLPPISRFGGGRAEKKQTVIDKLMAFFEKYLGLG